MKFCPRHLLQVQAFYERQAHDVELEAWPANLRGEKSSVQEKTSKATTYWAKAVINFKVCEVHSLLLSCPVWLHTPLRLITSRVNLNQYRYKLLQGWIFVGRKSETGNLWFEEFWICLLECPSDLSKNVFWILFALSIDENENLQPKTIRNSWTLMRNRYKPLKTFEFEIDKCLLTGLEVYHRRKMKLYISLL